MMLAGLLLAAGGATRFGSPKVLAAYRGEALVRRATRLLVPICPGGVFVVIGAEADRVRDELGGEAVRFIENPDWRAGLSTSIVRGVAGLPAGVDAVLLLLADTPAITAVDLEALTSAWVPQPERIVAAEFSGRAGPPVILPRSTWPQLAALRGDQGARSLLEWHPGLLPVAMPHAGQDVDTPADLARLEAGAAR